jgi:hypothetical protein
MKISFIAFKKRMTVPQLIMMAIMKSHDELVREGSIPIYDPFLSEKIHTFNKLLQHDTPGCVHYVMKINTI